MATAVTIAQALQRVADHPEPATDNWLELPVHELVCRRLFDIANNPDVQVAGSMTASLKAQKIILNRLVGTRRPGTHPVSSEKASVEFMDLTAGVLHE